MGQCFRQREEYNGNYYGLRALNLVWPIHDRPDGLLCIGQHFAATLQS